MKTLNDHDRLLLAFAELTRLGFVAETAVAADKYIAKARVQRRAGRECTLGPSQWAYWTLTDERSAFDQVGRLTGPLFIHLGGHGVHGPLQLALGRAGFDTPTISIGPSWCILWPDL